MIEHGINTKRKMVKRYSNLDEYGCGVGIGIEGGGGYGAPIQYLGSGYWSNGSTTCGNGINTGGDGVYLVHL